LVGVDSKEPKDLFFFVAAITTRVYANGGELAALTPALDRKRGDTEKLGYFADGQKIRKVFEIYRILCHTGTC